MEKPCSRDTIRSSNSSSHRNPVPQYPEALRQKNSWQVGRRAANLAPVGSSAPYPSSASARRESSNHLTQILHHAPYSSALRQQSRNTARSCLRNTVRPWSGPPLVRIIRHGSNHRWNGRFAERAGQQTRSSSRASGSSPRGQREGPFRHVYAHDPDRTSWSWYVRHSCNWPADDLMACRQGNPGPEDQGSIWLLPSGKFLAAPIVS